MSPSLTDRLCIYLHPDRIVVTHQGGVLKRRVKAQHAIAIPKSNEASGWRDLLTQLKSVLENPELKGILTKIIVSGHYLKYRVVPWNNALRVEEQVISLKHQFQEVYGEAALDWEVFISNTGFKKNELACAIEGEFLHALRALFAAKANLLLSIEPYLTVAFNSFRKKITTSSWVILIEGGHVYIANFTDNGWANVKSKAMTPTIENLAVFLRREILHAGGIESHTLIYFFWAEKPEYQLNIPGFDTIQTLSLDSMPALAAEVVPGISPNANAT